MSQQDILYRNKNDIIKHINDGKSSRWIGKKYGCNHGVVWSFLNDIGISTKFKQHKNIGKTNLYREEIIKRFKNGESAYSIAKSLDLKSLSVARALKRWGFVLVPKNDPNNPIIPHTEKILRLHYDGLSSIQIGKIVGFSGGAIIRLLRKNGVKVVNYKHSVDESFFEKIDNQDKAYVLGMLFSDGNIRLDGAIRLTLKEDDKEILEKINEVLDNKKPLRYIKSRNSSAPQYELCINRKKMADDLIVLGCVPRKSLILDFPHIKDDLVSHFVRGYFDGDGGIQGNATHLTSSFSFCNILKSILPCNITNIYQRYKDRDPHLSAHTIYIGRKEESLKFLNWIYKDANLFLKRKHDLYKNLVGVL